MYDAGFFEIIQPINYTTFATPHLGTVTTQPALLKRLINKLGRGLLSQSGRDLFLKDGGIVYKMADLDSSYFRILSKFERISLYANVANDRTVPFFTAFITTQDPFTDLHNCKPHYLRDYSPVLIDVSRPMTFSTVPSKKKWSRQQYAMFCALISVGPLVISVTLLAFLITTQISESRIRKLVESDYRLSSKMIEILPPFSTSELESVSIEESGSKATHFDTEASMMQSAVEDFMDAAETPDDIEEEYDESLETEESNKSTNATRSRSNSMLSLTEICQCVHKQRQTNPEFAKSQFCNDMPSPELMLMIEPIQVEMNKNLNKLPWHKYAVHIESTPRSHAAIINRKKILEEGKVVLSHWVENITA